METQNEFEVQKKSKEERETHRLLLLRCKYVSGVQPWIAREGGR